jgi:hypothetical protein
MAFVSSLYTSIRDGIGDSANARWTDAELLRQVNLAIVRAQALLQRNSISFGRKTHEFTGVAGTSAYELPGDFASVVGLWRTDTSRELLHKTQEAYDSTLTAAEATIFCVDGDHLRIMGTPTGAIPFRLRYWPVATAVTGNDSTPWGGKLDPIMVDYVRMRLFVNDEMDVTQDAQFLQDLENNILAQFALAEPAVVKHRGWLV